MRGWRTTGTVSFFHLYWRVFKNCSYSLLKEAGDSISAFRTSKEVRLQQENEYCGQRTRRVGKKRQTTCTELFIFFLFQRRIREAARLQAEEEKRIEDEKQAKLNKKNAFLNRAAAFQQKKGPSDDEVRETVKKESTKRNFGRKLDRLLKYLESPGQSAQMRGRAGNNTSYGDEDYTGDDSKEDSVSDGLRPPPPPSKKLIGLGSSSAAPPPPPPPPPRSTGDVENNKSTLEEPLQPKEASPWTYVVENEAVPYYWNILTNETTLAAPPDYDGAIYSASAFNQLSMASSAAETANAAEAASLRSWYELETENGELIYQRISDGFVQYEKPQGVSYISVVGEDGVSVEHWQVMFDETQQKVFYQNTSTNELLDDTARPFGVVTVVELEHGECEH